MGKLSHLDAKGQAHMVDVSAKAATARRAVAAGSLHAAPETLALIKRGEAPKGDVIAAARIAGIMAAKKTAELIPLCHPLNISSVELDFALNAANGRIDVEAAVKLSGQTGVEMEALTAVSVALLTLYDMLKAVDKNMRLDNIRLMHKSGGKSGVYDREEKSGA